MSIAEKDMFVVLEDRGDDGQVMVLVREGEKMLPSYADLPKVPARFDPEGSRYVPVDEPPAEPETPRRRRRKPERPETEADLL